MGISLREHEHHSGCAISIIALSLAITIAVSSAIWAISSPGCGWGKGSDPLDGWRIGRRDRSTPCGVEVCPGRQKRRIRGVGVHEPTNPTIGVIELFGVLRAPRIFFVRQAEELATVQNSS